MIRRNNLMNTSVLLTAVKKGSTYKITLKDNEGKALANQKITVNGKEFTTDKNGVVNYKLSASKVGTQKLTVKFAGDGNYVDSTATAKLTVKKEAVKILKAKKTYTFKKSKKAKNIKVTLKNSKNKVMKYIKVTIKLSGKKIKGKKTITAKTNKKGVVTFKLGKKLTKKTKIKYTITYKGNSYYNKVTKKGKINIK